MFERFPKINSPFERSENEDGRYTVDPILKEDFEWVLEDDEVIAVEKLDGRNIAVQIDSDGNVSEIYTREGNLCEPFISQGDSYIIKGVLEAFERGWIDKYLSGDSLYYGELVGPKVQGNPYDLTKHMWVPFTYAQQNISYNSWGDYPKTYSSISNWFTELIPLFYSRIHNIKFTELTNDAYVEGIVFTHPSKNKYAKLRRDMFDWYYGDLDGN